MADPKRVVERHVEAFNGGGRGRNTEILTFDDEDKIARTRMSRT